MVTTTELVSTASSAVEASTPHLRSRRTTSGRTCDDVATELCEMLTRVPDAVADAEALLDIAGADPLGEELEGGAAFIAAALFLGRRMITSNLDELAKLEESGDLRVDAVREVTAILDELSRRLREVVVGLRQAADDAAA